jgi:hypothetical protein
VVAKLSGTESPQMSAKLKLPLLFNTPAEQQLTLEEVRGWKDRARADLDRRTAIEHAGTGLPFDVVRATITRGDDDITAAWKLLLKEQQ